MHLVDIALHGGVAAAGVAALGLIGAQWPAALLASAGFMVREELQAVEKYSAWLMPWQWSSQKLAEGLVPVATALAVALLWRHAERLMGAPVRR